MHIRRRLALQLLCSLLAVPAGAQTVFTNAVGSSSAGTFSEYLACSGDRVLIGFELRYGPTGIGKVRGVCREVGAGGAWSGSASTTSWTPTNNNIESVTAVSRICDSGWAVSGYEARLSGPNIHRLRFACGELTDDGMGPARRFTAWAGPSAGSSSGTLSCPANAPVAQGFQTRSRSLLHYFRLHCGEVPMQEELRATVTLNGWEVYSYADSKGFRFEAYDAAGREQPGCRTVRHRDSRLGLEVIVMPPATRMECRFDLFARNGILRNGWTIQGARIAQNSSCTDTGRIYGLRRGSSDPKFSYYQTHRQTGPSVLSCIPALDWVKLEGPADQDWRMAFE